MYPSETILQSIGDMGRAKFQYRQIRAMVSSWMKNSNVFKPMMSIETLLTSTEKTKQLSIV